MRHLPHPQLQLLLPLLFTAGLDRPWALAEEEALVGRCGSEAISASTGEAAASALQLMHDADRANLEAPPQATVSEASPTEAAAAATAAAVPVVLVPGRGQRRKEAMQLPQRVGQKPSQLTPLRETSEILTSPTKVTPDNLLTDKLSTSESFEMSFFLTIHGVVAERSAVLLCTKTNSPGGGQYLDIMPGFYLAGGSTLLSIVLGHELDFKAGLDDVAELDLNKNYHINVRLEGDTLAVEVNGNSSAVRHGYWGVKYPAQTDVSVWACDNNSVPANATIALVTYDALETDEAEHATKPDTEPRQLLPADDSSVMVDEPVLLVNNLTTGSNFEMSFNIRPANSSNTLTSILRVTKTDTQAGHLYDAMPAFYFLPGRPELVVVMGREDDTVANISSSFILEPYYTWPVTARLQDDTFTLLVDGVVVGTKTGYRGKKYGPVRNAKVLIGDPFFEPAHANISAITYMVLADTPNDVADTATVHVDAAHSPPSRSSPLEGTLEGKQRTGAPGMVAEDAHVPTHEARSVPADANSTNSTRMPGGQQVPPLASKKGVPETVAQLPRDSQPMSTPSDEVPTNSSVVVAESAAAAASATEPTQVAAKLPAHTGGVAESPAAVSSTDALPLPADTRIAESAAAVSSSDAVPVATEGQRDDQVVVNQRKEVLESYEDYLAGRAHAARVPVATQSPPDTGGMTEPGAAASSTDAMSVAARIPRDNQVVINRTQEANQDSVAGHANLAREHAIANLWPLLLVLICVCALPSIYFAMMAKHTDKAVQTDLSGCS